MLFMGKINNFMKLARIKEHFKYYKYLLPSISLLVAILLMLAFQANNFGNFLNQIWETALYSWLVGIGIYIIAIFSSWLIFPFMPKYEDFSNNEERENYYNLFNSPDLTLFIFIIIAATLVFSGYIK